MTHRAARAHRTGAAMIAALITSTAAGAQAPSHVYTLDGTLADALGGPSLVAIGTVTPTTEAGASGYRFEKGSGFSLSNALASPSVYSIELRFLFDQTTSYRKIVDTKNRAEDQGLYNLNTSLNYFPTATGPAGVITDGTLVTTVLTRDAAGTVVGYANGVSQITLADVGGDATFTAPGSIIHFLLDDLATGGGEASAGFVDYIRLYDQALTAQQVAALTPPAINAVPEPGSIALVATGLLALGGAARRRRTTR